MNIAILLSTYNGEHYLRELLESILKQTYSDWKVYIRDDNSNDETINIISKYCNNYNNKFTLIQDIKENIGAKRSFSKLLESTNADYYMFCDQDDIWLPEKIELSIAKILSVEKNYPNLPVLIHSDLRVVDEKLNTIHESFLAYSRLNPKLLSSFSFISINNCVTGCTTMFNQKAKLIIEPIPDNAIMHDWWAALIVSQNGIIDFLDSITVLYRQHTNNVVGARNIKLQYYFNRFITFKATINDNIKVFNMNKIVGNTNPITFIFKKIYLLIYKNFWYKS